MRIDPVEQDLAGRIHGAHALILVPGVLEERLQKTRPSQRQLSPVRMQVQ
ncbi:hypothetical protein ACQ859_26705 [Roseateles chitinivorans]